MASPLLLSVDDRLARITLNRPERLNAFDPAMAAAFRDAVFDVVARDDVAAILLDAAGPAFCAGGDVFAMAQATAGSQVERLAGVINKALVALIHAPVPVAAAAHGTTAGGGLGLLLSSDYAVVGANSELASLYANVGLTPDLSVSALLARAVGERRALQLVLTDRRLAATEALDWGLVAEVVGDAGTSPAAIADEVRARAETIARGWIDGASGAYGQAKRLVRASGTRPLAEHLGDEARTIGEAALTDDARARIRAFNEASKRRRHGRKG